jgi:uncharacterized lipoprotein YmbA
MRVAVWLRILLVVTLVGCLPSARPDPSTFFALASSESSDGTAAGSWDVALGLGPVAIPAYLDRPQLVSRVGPNELKLAADARWAEPLREGIARTLRQDLATASGARQVALYPWPITTRVDLAVGVDILRFEPDARGAVELAARWTIRETAHGHVLAVHDSHVTEPVEGAGNGAEVAALSRALAELAREIAAGLRDARLPSH